MFYAAELNGEYFFFTDTEDLPSFASIAAINPAGLPPSGSMMRSHTIRRNLMK